MQFWDFSVSWPKSKTSLEMTVAMRIRLKQKEIEQSCLGNDLIYGVALFLLMKIFWFKMAGYGWMSFEY